MFDKYTPDILKTTNMASIHKKIGKLSIAVYELEEALKKGGAVLSGQDICLFVEEGLPIEPFIIGIKKWEEAYNKRKTNENIDEHLKELLLDKVAKTSQKAQFPLNKKAYSAFLEHREKTLRKKVTVAGARKQKKILRAYPEEIQYLIIEKAITKGHEGIFHPSNTELKSMQAKAERLRADAKAEILGIGINPNHKTEDSRINEAGEGIDTRGSLKQNSFNETIEDIVITFG